MMRSQRGASTYEFILWFILIALAVILAVKLVPGYAEYFNIKKTVKRLVNEGSTKGEIIKGYNNQEMISNFSSLKAKDLKMTAKNDLTVNRVYANYRYERPLFAGIGIYIDFKLDVTRDSKSAD